MFKRIRRQPATTNYRHWALSITNDCCLTIGARQAEVTPQDLEALLTRVDTLALNASVIVFDFSATAQFRGPWGVHFAMLIELARRLKKQVKLRGLNQQPASLAWLFRGSKAIREMIAIDQTLPLRKVA